MTYFYLLYDSDLDIKITVNVPSMTVEQLKISRDLKPGFWSHHKYMTQTYKVEIYKNNRWVLLNDIDTIDFTTNPRINITLVHD